MMNFINILLYRRNLWIREKKKIFCFKFDILFASNKPEIWLGNLKFTGRKQLAGTVDLKKNYEKKKKKASPNSGENKYGHNVFLLLLLFFVKICSPLHEIIYASSDKKIKTRLFIILIKSPPPFNFCPDCFHDLLLLHKFVWYLHINLFLYHTIWCIWLSNTPNLSLFFFYFFRMETLFSRRVNKHLISSLYDCVFFFFLLMKSDIIYYLLGLKGKQNNREAQFKHSIILLAPDSHVIGRPGSWNKKN